MIGSKKCTKCGIEKELSDFHAHPQMRDGHVNQCKKCRNAACRGNYKSYENERQQRRIARNKQRIEIESRTHKICIFCEENKSLNDFYPCSTAIDGRYNRCKKCYVEQGVEYRRINPEIQQRYWIIVKLTPGHNAKNAIRLAKYRKINPMKARAHDLLNAAIRYGKIAPKPCVVCGSTDLVHGHHADYTLPLEVRWLCPACHAEEHCRLRKAVSRSEET